MKIKAIKRIGFIAACMLLFVGQAFAQQTVSEVRVEGNQRIEPATILSYMNLSVGDPITRPAMDESLKSLFATGLFVDVTLRQDGSIVYVEVVENPVINEIAFEGNDKVKDDELLNEIQLRPRQVFSRTKVQSDVARLYQIYRRNGRFSVTIEPKVIKLDQNRVNLVFEIQEGAITAVEKISFVGNKRFDDDTLRSEVSTKEEAWYRFMTTDDRYDPDRLAYDQELLRKFYLKEGYADFRIISANAELSSDQKDFFITFTLEEGERYKLNAIKLNSDIRNLDVAPLKKELNLETGDWYDADRVQENVDKLTKALNDMQYAFVSVKPDIQRNREAKTIDITFQINETPRVFVERINVNGNIRTLDKVIRREMTLAEGDPFNRSKLARSEQKIKDLDYFETVDVKTTPGSAPDKSIIDVDVSEKSTGELSIGAGFSTSDGPLADFRIRERNLMGKGQDLQLAAVIAGRRTEFDLGFTEPHFLDRDLSAGFDLFHMTRDLQDESSYDQKRTGGGLRVGYPLSERWRQSFGYRIEQNEITNVDTDASRFIRDQEGERITSAINQRLTYDSRDSTLFPTDGWLYWLETELAGLGGDAKYVSGKTGTTYYTPIVDQWILSLTGEVGAMTGYSDTDVEINERFFVGGGSLRGFERSGIGPRDAVTDDALGGNYFYRASAETSFPIAEDLGVQGHVFNDIGSLWEVDETGAGILDENSIRAAAGVGLSWRSPFGPIRLDVAAPYLKEDYDEEELFRFNFGTRF